ncbi:hypothetical protein HCN44_007497 [Aphidius gifuensis]|uniref:glutathione transferase n=1 Tax=Aphidius gifuensis TaxID=684658 RepID=A0A834XIY3_APHGI|nr:glutathione S-transferase-like [Aphidius gifuensis]KAF7988003.1 hypothetical protein HCN44_007497 [Aphidius gifuensis]
MSSYKLTYFNMTGRAEPIRYMLSYAGIDFEDKRVSFEEWSSLKAEMPLGQMPVLEIDGKIYNQSKSIYIYLGKKLNIAGDNYEEDYEINNAVDTMDDLKHPLTTWYFEKDATTKETLKEKAFSKIDLLLGKLEETVKKNNGYFVGGKLTWADLAFTAYNDFLSNITGKNIITNYPELQKLVKKIAEIPKIKAYLSKRPVTQV